MPRWIFHIFWFVPVIFFGLNYNWTHAALAGLVGPSTCQPSLEAGARRAVAGLFGEAQSSPIILCLDKPVMGLAISHGTARFAPLLPTIVVLGPQGMNPNVASHEYAHAELRRRTSALLRTYRIPTWFDEGLAMQLDNRPDYSESALRTYLRSGSVKTPSLNNLERPVLFFRPGVVGKAHYAFAKCVVRRWLDDTKAGALRETTASVGWFSRFPSEQFEGYEADCLTTDD